MGMSYFLSSIFLTASVIFLTKTVCHAGMGHARQPTGSGMKEPKMNFKTHRNFDKPQEMLTHYGKQFVLGLLNPSHSQENAGKFEIFIQALENNTEIRVGIPYTTFNKTYDLTRHDDVTKIEIPKQVLMAGKTKIENKGVEITADKDIAVYAFSKDGSGRGDGFVVHPKTSLGLEHVVTTYSGSHSNIGVVGVENDTIVRIVLNGRSRLSYKRRVYKNGDVLRVTLNRLQTLHIRSRFDLSGARIIADKPVAVFSGASCAELAGVSPNCDFVVDQVPAVKTWGQEYVVHGEESPSMRGGGLVRVTSARVNTVVRLENGMETRMGIGGVMDLVVNPRWPTLITCAPFCMATLYKTHSSVNESQIGPSVSILPPTNQFLAYYSVYITKEERGSAFLNILIKCSASGGLVVNDVLLTDLVWQASESKTWCGATVKVAKVGVNTVHHQDGGTRFGVLVNGVGGRHSYSYSGGRRFQVARKEKGLATKMKPTNVVKSEEIISEEIISEKIIRLNDASKREPKVYMLTTAVLSALCGIMLLSLAVFLSLRYINSKKASTKDAENTDAKLADDRTYQSIRGFPRRNTLAYEEVKLPLKPNNHPSIADVLLPPGEKCLDYENLKFLQKDRDSCNPYVAMDEALSGRVMVEQLSTMSDESGIYLTMKKLIKDQPQETQQVPEDTQKQ